MTLRQSDLEFGARAKQNLGVIRMSGLKGGCLCGAVRYSIGAEPIGARMCWCRDCQRIASGSATVNVLFDEEAVAITGDLALFTIAAAGLAVLAQSYAPLFLAVKYAGALYLLYLAWRLWNSAPEAETITADVPSESGFSLFMTSLTLTLGNPKPIIFFVALLPTIVDLNTLSLLGFAEIAVVIAVIISLTLWTYAFAAARACLALRSLMARARQYAVLARWAVAASFWRWSSVFPFCFCASRFAASSAACAAATAFAAASASVFAFSTAIWPATFTASGLEP
jgi:threonine/homoserine/homoserine lactone efflux protein